ncbi:hypothetical protein [Terriglobus sp. TAA 43]|uniref:hypothetical protein n=1 Tax=Terriglobus sp. TAA 43 TaxID=278961 RepID=UPI000689E54A|nr:hypothetical protein [Terriglobus sp. TAA 43]
MTDLKPACSAPWTKLAVIAVVLSPALFYAQQVQPPPPAPPPVQTAKPQSDADTHMTKSQAADLFKSVDEVIGFVASDSHLKATRPVKRRLLTRPEVNKELMDRMKEDEGAKRLQRSELVLKKFGFIERDFHLQPFLLSLLTEQVAAFYDPKTRTVNMLDWVKPDEQKPVLAHELTHAVQDDRVKLEKWGSPAPTAIAKNVREDNEHIQLDEASTARESVTEGQAMAVFVDYELQPMGKTLKDAPEFGERVREMSSDTSGSPVLSRAPLLLQESLLFPYGQGLAFEQAILQAKGVDAAFAGTLDRPPTSSHEVMHPEVYMAKTPVPVLTMPNVHTLLDKDWDPYDVGVMGELDVRIITELFGGRAMADPLAVAWNGGIYYAAQKKTGADKASPSSIGIVYYSQWKNQDSARSFLKIYASQLPRKYRSLKQVDIPNGDDDHLLFSTEEGDVWLSLDAGGGVFLSEGFDRDTAKKLETLYREVQGHGPLQQASEQPMHELTSGLRNLMPGIPKAALDYGMRTASHK